MTAERPLYRWTLADFASDLPSHVGLEPTVEAAKGALTAAVRASGGFGPRMTANVHRPSGGGWRAVPDGMRLSWEEWGIAPEPGSP